ncbi:MAG: DMT family transporter [Candidatus Dormibacteria bacterium]
MSVQPPPARRTGLIDRYSALVIAVAAALWATDAYFRPALARQLSASQIVLIESLIVSLCLLPLAPRVVREMRHASWRAWLAVVVIAAGPQAFATVLFTASLTHAGTSAGVLSEVYLLYLLQPVFGMGMAWIFLGERRKRRFWPLAAVALGGAALIVFSTNAVAPRGQLIAAAFVVGAVVLWAAGTVLGRYALGGVSFTTTTAMRFTLALPFLLALMLTDPAAAHHQYAWSQLPSFLGIALVPGLVAMVLYYRALSSTPASISSVAELGYPAAFFLILSLPAPVGYAMPLQPLEVLGAVLLVAAVTALNLFNRREVVTTRASRELRLASEPSSG